MVGKAVVPPHTHLQGFRGSDLNSHPGNTEALWDIFQSLGQQEVSGLLLTGLRGAASGATIEDRLKGKLVHHSLFVT